RAGGLHMRRTTPLGSGCPVLALLAAAALPLILTACGGGYGGGGGGSGGSLSCGSGYSNACPPPTVTLTAPASGATVSGTVALTATASASSTYGLTATSVVFLIDGTAVGTVTINEGFAGATGPALIRLSPSGDNTAEWEVPADALLTAEQLTALSQGKLYVIATSAANPRGEIRGQIAPDNVAVTFSTMAPAAEARSVSPAAGGVVATTVDKSAYTLSI